MNEFEAFAVSLAQLAGDKITSSTAHPISVANKSPNAECYDPVTDTDKAVEALIHQEIRSTYSSHAIIGEEFGLLGNPNSEFTWAIDPIDGTRNFISRLPFFSSSICLLRNGNPVAAAIWCSVTPFLSSGVFHSSLHSGIKFEGRDLPPLATHRGASYTFGSPKYTTLVKGVDHRKIGSVALESALVAIGSIDGGYFPHPRIWDIGAGICLSRSAGKSIFLRSGNEWQEVTESHLSARDTISTEPLKHKFFISREKVLLSKVERAIF